VTWDMIYILASLPPMVWMFNASIFRACRFYGRPAPRWVRWIHFEGRPFMPALLIGVYLAGGIASGTDGMAVRLLLLLLGLANWWIARRDEDDDDRWKRRREALSAKVAEVGGRLQVVPAGGESR
jgi:hypothetical protein